MIRIAIFTDNDFEKVNGVTTTLRAVVQHAAGDVVPRVYTASRVQTTRAEYFAVKSIGVGLPWYREMSIYWPQVRALEREVVRDGADVVHITTPGPIGVAARIIAARLGLPVTGSFHANLGDYVATFSGSATLGRAMDRYMRWVYGPCDPLLVPSTATRDALARGGYGAERLQLWSRGVDTDRFAPARRSPWLRRRWDVDDRCPALLYVGRLSREKGLDLLPAIQRQLAVWGTAHRFVLVGDGPMAPALRRMCPDAVFLGMRSHDEVAVAMASADVFLFPSATDTLGNVVLEAQASGLPVVVADRGGPREQVREGVTGWIARSGEGSEFADRVRVLLRHPETRREMSARARSFALERSWPASMVPLLQAWRLAARRRAPVSRPLAGPGAVHAKLANRSLSRDQAQEDSWPAQARS